MKLYTSMSVVEKIAHFHDWNVDDFIPLLLSDKLRMQQTERTTMMMTMMTTTMVGGSYLDGRPKVGHGHSLLRTGTWTVAGIIIPPPAIVGVDQPAIQHRFEMYSAAKIAQCADIHKASGGD
jgi:hypothetical protein